MSYKSDLNQAYSKLNKINSSLKKENENESLIMKLLLPKMLNKIQKYKITKNKQKYSISYKTVITILLLIIFLMFFFTFNYMLIIISFFGICFWAMRTF